MAKTKNKKNVFGNFLRPSMFVFGIFALCIFVATTLSTRAASQISLTSVLFNSDGRVVPEGEYDIRFAIYASDRTDTAQAVGSAVWQETQRLVVSNGRVRTFLGVSVALPQDLDFKNNQYYLGVQIGDDSEMTPRKQLTSVANALHADSASEASSLLGKVLGTKAGDIPTLSKGGKLLVSMLPIGSGAKQLITGSDSRLHDPNTDTGTDSKTFNIGSGSSASSSNFDLTVSNDAAKPALRYNGSLGQWQYSDNGTTFQSLASTGGVSSLAGTTDQISVSAASGNITLSLPQSIATSSSPTFAALTTSSGGNIFVGGGISTFDTAVADGYAEFSGICLGNGTSCITDWAAAGGLNGSGSAGHIAFWDDANTLAYDTNGGFYWDSSNNRLGIGTTSPSATLSVEGDASINGGLYATSLTINGQASLGVLGQNVTLNSSMVPSVGGLNLGSATNHWANIYADNISVGAMNVSGTTAEYFTINTDATLDEPAGIRFYKGSLANGYAALNWMDGVEQSFVLYSKESDSTLAALHTGDLTVNTNDLVVTGGKVGIGDATPLSLLTVGTNDAFQVNSSGAIVAATGITSSGSITFSALTPSRMVFTGSSSELVNSATSSVIASSVTDKTGTGQLVFATGPTFVAPTLGAAIATSLSLSSALGVTSGGTGTNSLTTNGVLYGNGTSAVGVTAAGTDGQLLLGATLSVPAFVTLGGDATLTAGGVLTIGSGKVDTGKILNGTIQGVDLSSTNAPTDGYIIVYDSVSGGFTWIPNSGGTGASKWTDNGSYTYLSDATDNLVIGDTVQNSGFYFNVATSTLSFEGTTNDGYETILAVVDPTTTDRTITFPDATGTVITTGNLSSVTTVGTVTLGTWNGTAIGAAYGGTGLNTSASSGVATVASGVWSINSSLAVAYGGTGTTTLASNGVLYGNGTGAVQATTAGTNGQILVGVTSGAPAFATLKGDATIANDGTLTIGTGKITTGMILDGTIRAIDVYQTNSATNGYMLSYDSASGGFTWVSPGAVGAGDITDVGSCSSGPCFVDGTNDSLVFEGSTSDANEITLSAADPTADRNILLPNAEGTIALINGGQTFNSATWQGTTIAVAYGGTGTTTLASNGVLYGNGTGAVQATTAGTNGQILVANVSGVPTFVSVTGDAALAADGTLTIGTGKITTGMILDGTVQSGDLNAGNAANAGLILSSNGDGTFTWIANSGGSGASKWTDAVSYTYLTDTSDNLVIGGSTVDTGFYFNVAASTLTFEGATANAYETTLAVSDPLTADRTITFPDATGTVLTTGNLTAITAVGTVTSGTWNGTTIGIGSGGTGLTSTPTNGQLLIGNGTGYTLATLTAGAGSGITITNGAGSISIAATLGTSVDLTSEVTGTLPVANGGTGATTFTTNGVLYGNGTGAVGSTAAGTAGQALIAGGAGAPSWYAPTAGSLLFAGTSGILAQDNPNLFWDDTNNWLGIGTSSPAAPLHISGSGNGIRLAYDSTHYTTLSVGSGGNLTSTAFGATDAALAIGNGSDQNTSIQFDRSTQDYYIGTDNSDNVFKIGAGLTVGTTPYMSINASGNVGIGDASPTALLTVGSGDLFRVNSSGAITAAAGITSSGTINFSGLTASSMVFTDASKNLVSSATSSVIAGSLSDEVGTGGLVFANGPTLIAPTLGAAAATSLSLSTALPATSGGTGLSSYAVGDIIYASTTSALSALPDVALGNVLISGGVSTAPAWGKITGSHVTADALDFTELADTLALDANLTVNQSTNTWTQNFTGTTTTGLTYNANSLTTGTAMIIASTSTAGGTSGSSYLLNLSKSGSNANASHTAYGLYSTVSNVGTTSTNVAGYFSASGGTNNYGLIVANGYASIGSTAPSTKLYVSGASATTSGISNPSSVSIVNTNTTDNNLAQLVFSTNDLASTETTGTIIGTVFTDHTAGAVSADFTFTTRNAGNAGERMRILSSGNVGIGDTSPTSLFTVGSGDLFQVNSSGAIAAAAGVTSSGTITFSGLVSCGGIQTNGSGVLACTSDARLKDVRAPFTAGLEAINNINPQTYSWKAGSAMYDGGVLYSGFIAQNIQSALPEAVNVNPDGYLQISTTTILAATINAVKEQQGEIEVQKAVTDALSLKTDSNVSSLVGAQDSFREGLLTVNATLSEHEAMIKSQETVLDRLEARDADNQTVLSQLQADVAAQETLEAALQTQLADLQTQVQTLMDFYSTLQLGSVVTADAQGNVDLLGGKLHVSEVTASGVAIEVVDPDAPTIGTATLYPVAKDADNDGKDDYTGKLMADPEVVARDGKTVKVLTKATTAQSHVFTTQRTASDQVLAVTKTKAGESFTVESAVTVTKPIEFDWWVVEEK